jgi:hypothetical protein
MLLYVNSLYVNCMELLSQFHNVLVLLPMMLISMTPWYSNQVMINTIDDDYGIVANLNNLISLGDYKELNDGCCMMMLALIAVLLYSQMSHYGASTTTRHLVC